MKISKTLLDKLSKMVVVKQIFSIYGAQFLHFTYPANHLLKLQEEDLVHSFIPVAALDHL
jgi:hypothetical protein